MALNINELETIVTPIAAIAAFVVRYGNTETDYLKSRDKLLGEAIDKIGHIKRPVDTDLFSSVIQHIIGQQISSAAQKTIWQRMQVALGEVNTNTITGNAVEELQKVDKKLFEKYRRRYSPYGTVASLYIWAIAGGAIPEMRDFALRKRRKGVYENDG